MVLVIKIFLHVSILYVCFYCFATSISDTAIVTIVLGENLCKTNTIISLIKLKFQLGKMMKNKI
jgi:hypothetical protein